jgi:hypothetical protein
MKRIGSITLALAMAVTVSSCAKRKIDTDETGSVNVPGTSWQIFCDGPNAVMWVPGHGSGEDEIEAYVYEHWYCAPSYYEANPDAEPRFSDPTQSDSDGIIEEED